MSLKNQRRLAAQLLKAGSNRVWIDPNRINDVEIAITRAEIRRLIHEGAIKKSPVKGVSRARARVIHAKKKEGLRRGKGSRKGSKRAKITKKDRWMAKIRVLRRTMREWKASRAISDDAYRRLYMVAQGGRFGSVADMERYAKAHGMWRKR